MGDYGIETSATDMMNARQVKEMSRHAINLRKWLAPEQRPERVVELFAGVGRQADSIQALWPNVPAALWDLSPGCCEVLRDRFRELPCIEIHEGNSFEADLGLKRTDGVVIDTNIMTLKTAKEEPYLSLLDRVFRAQPLWVMLTDISYSKLHLNYKSYGCTSPNQQDYAHRFNDWTWENWHYGCAGIFREDTRMTWLKFKGA